MIEFKAVLPRPLFRVSRLWTAVAMLLALVGALFATVPLLTNFEPYDDEGYMLLSLAHYINEGHLYTQTHSLYGPFYYYAQGVFFQLLHLPLNHETGRLVTLIYWVASTLLATFFVYRYSKSTFLACAAGLCAMLAGMVLTQEPCHPQQLVLLLWMFAACLALPPLSGQNYFRLFALGCVGSALVFTKVNVGVFYMAGLAQALVCLLPSGRIRSIGIGVMLIYAATAPWLLMHGSFNHGNFRSYCALATVGGVVTFACGALVRPYTRLPIGAALWSGAGLLAGTMLIIGATALQGMPMSSLIWGVFLNPLHMPDTFSAPLSISSLDFLFASFLTAGVVGLIRSGDHVVKSQWFNVLKCAAGIGSVLLLPLPHKIQWIVPLLPLTLIPAPHWERDSEGLFSRLFVTYMAVTQFLVPYPVAGSQKAIAAAPMILWAFICIVDGIVALRTSSIRSFEDSGSGLRLDAMIGGAILVVSFAGASIVLSAESLPPASTGLRGAAWLHLPVELATRFESIARSVRKNCRILFTMPGMGSFNFWSGVPTPNGWNLNTWITGISSEKQGEILSIIKDDSQACAIVNRNVLRFFHLDEERVVATLPLAHYLMIDMPSVTKFGPYEIHVHPYRSSPWLQ